MHDLTEGIKRFIRSQKIALNIIYVANLLLMISIPIIVLNLDFKLATPNTEKIYHVLAIAFLLILVSLVNFYSLTNPDKVILDIKRGKYKASSSFGSFLIKNVEEEFYLLSVIDKQKCAVTIGVTLACLRSWVLNLAIVIVAVASQHLGVINLILMNVIIAISFILNFMMYPKVEKYFKEL